MKMPKRANHPARTSSYGKPRVAVPLPAAFPRIDRILGSCTCCMHSCLLLAYYCTLTVVVLGHVDKIPNKPATMRAVLLLGALMALAGVPAALSATNLRGAGLIRERGTGDSEVRARQLRAARARACTCRRALLPLAAAPVGEATPPTHKRGAPDSNGRLTRPAIFPNAIGPFPSSWAEALRSGCACAAAAPKCALPPASMLGAGDARGSKASGRPARHRATAAHASRPPPLFRAHYVPIPHLRRYLSRSVRV